MKYCALHSLLTHLGQWIIIVQTLGITVYTEQPRKRQIIGFMSSLGFVGWARPLTSFLVFNILRIF